MENKENSTGVALHASMALVYSQQKTLGALIHARPGMDIQAIVLAELDYLQMQANLNPKLLLCTPESISCAVKSAIRKNLTLDPSAGLVYCMTRNVTISVGNSSQTVVVLETKETCNGRISVARQCGRIIDHKRPEIEMDKNGKVLSVKFEYQLPNGRWEVCKFGDYEFERWMNASAKQNKGAANALYTNWKGGIDPEFARAKAINHSLKKLGININDMYGSQKISADAPINGVSAEAATSEVKEEFSTHEDVTEETGSLVKASETPVNVIVHDVVQIPNI